MHELPPKKEATFLDTKIIQTKKKDIIEKENELIKK